MGDQESNESLSGLQEKLRMFAEARDWDQFHSPKNLSMALIVEAAELVEHFQWLTQNQSETLPDDKLRKVEEELADILIYLLRISDKLGIDLLQAASQKINRNEEKYPVNLSKGRSTKYTDFPTNKE